MPAWILKEENKHRPERLIFFYSLKKFKLSTSIIIIVVSVGVIVGAYFLISNYFANKKSLKRLNKNLKTQIVSITPKDSDEDFITFIFYIFLGKPKFY